MVSNRLQAGMRQHGFFLNKSLIVLKLIALTGMSMIGPYIILCSGLSLVSSYVNDLLFFAAHSTNAHFFHASTSLMIVSNSQLMKFLFLLVGLLACFHYLIVPREGSHPVYNNLHIYMRVW